MRSRKVRKIEIFVPNYQNTCIAIGDHKEAMLYFPHVIICHRVKFSEVALAYSPTMTDEERKRNLIKVLTPISSGDLLPPDLLDHPDFLRDHTILDFAVVGEWMTAMTELLDQAKGKSLGKGLPKTRNIPLDKTLTEFLTKYKLQDATIFGDPSFFKPERKPNDVFLALSKSEIIDLTNATYDQLFAFRKDKETQHKLRRFRLFAYETYQGKSKAYIEDDIGQRIQDYHEAGRKHGFQFRIANLSFWLNSHFFMAAAGGSILSHAFGGLSEIESALAGSAGAFGIEIGKFALQLSNQKFELAETLKENPVSFIVDAKDKLASQRKE